MKTKKIITGALLFLIPLSACSLNSANKNDNPFDKFIPHFGDTTEAHQSETSDSSTNKPITYTPTTNTPTTNYNDKYTHEYYQNIINNMQTVIDTITYDGNEHTLKFPYELPSCIIVHGAEYTYVDAGTYFFLFSLEDISGTYAIPNPLDGILTIKKKPINVPKITQKYYYNGKEQTVLSSNEYYKVRNGSATKPGNYTATVTLTSDNYCWSSAFSGKIDYTIQKGQINLSSYLSNSTVEYDGEEHNIITGNVSLPEGVEIEVTTNGNMTDVGTHTVTATIKDNDYYESKPVTGTLTVTTPLSYKLNEDGSEYSITGIKYPQNGKTYKKVVIPSYINGLPVTKIADNAFSNVNYINEITLSPTIKEIGKYAFAYSSIQNINFAEGLETINDFALYKCKNLEKLNLPNGLKEIGDSALVISNYGKINNTLKEFSFPDSVEVIKSNDFSILENFIYEENGYQYFGNEENKCVYLYKAPTSLSNYVINENCKIIGNNSFSNQPSLKEITLPDSVTTICDYAFANCSYLTKLTVGMNLKNITITAFGWSYNIKEFVIPENNKYLSIKNDFVLKDNGETLCFPLFQINSQTSITVPDGIKTIDTFAFSQLNYATESIILPDSLQNIKSYAFYNSNLETLTIPNGVRYIEEYALSNMSNLKKLFIESTKINIEDNNFLNLQNLTTLFLMPGIIQNYSLEENRYLYNTKNNRFVKYVSQNGTPAKNSYTIKEGTIGIEPFAFANAPFEYYNLPDSIYDIRYSCFANSKIKEFTFPKYVIWTEDSLFENCENLETVNINQDLQNISGSAFYNCPKLKNFSIDKNNTYLCIENNAILSNDKQNLQYYFGKEDTKYQTPKTVTSISSYAFDSTCNIKEMIFSEGVENIYYNVLQNCDTLESVYFPSTLTYFESMSLSGKNLKTIYCNSPYLIGMETYRYNFYNNCTTLYIGENILEDISSSIINNYMNQNEQTVYNNAVFETYTKK